MRNKRHGTTPRMPSPRQVDPAVVLVPCPSKRPVTSARGHRACERGSWLGGSLKGASATIPGDAASLDSSLVEALCPLAEGLKLAVRRSLHARPGRGQARAGAGRAERGAVQGRGVALLRRIGSLRTPGSRLPSSPGRLRRSHRVCTRLQRYGGGSHSGPTRGETGSTNSHVGPTARNPARAPPHLHTKKAAHAAG